MADLGNTSVFSQTDASNGSGTMPSWLGSAAPSTLDDAGRALQGAVTREWNWRNPTITAGGTADVKTLTYSVAPAAYYNGQRFAFISNTTNTTTVTLNVNSLGAKTIKKIINGTVSNLAAGEMVSGNIYEVAYNTAGNCFYLLADATTLTKTSNTFTASQVIEVTDNTNAALRVTQLGTGPALRVEDSANPDSTPFIVTATGNVGIGEATPPSKLTLYDASSAFVTINGDSSTGVIAQRSSTDATPGVMHCYKARGTSASRTIVSSGDAVAQFAGSGYDGSSFVSAGAINIAVDGTPGLNDMPGRIQFLTTADGASAPTERMRITSTGKVGIGTTNPAVTLEIVGSANDPGIALSGAGGATTYGYLFGAAGGVTLGCATAEPLTFWTNAMEVGRFAGDGTFYVGATTLDPNSSTDTGAYIAKAGRLTAAYDSAAALLIGRQTNDGNLVQFYQAGVNEGAISVSGTTVTYGSFSGSHWSQLSDGSKPDILVGTVVETIDEKCVWPGAENDQLAKFKISDTPASKRVYGVFMAWDNDDDTTNDAYITGLGAYLVRIAAGVTVQGGDLLESNGDGCARVQADDIIRSSTIGKVTCNIPTVTYPDGSYTVPCVLYCG